MFILENLMRDNPSNSDIRNGYHVPGLTVNNPLHLLLDKQQIESGYYLPDVDFPVWKIPVKNDGSMDSILVSRKDPLGKEVNLFDSEPAIRERMTKLLIHLMKEEGCPNEQFD
jgi:hypothetical protein